MCCLLSVTAIVEHHSEKIKGFAVNQGMMMKYRRIIITMGYMVLCLLLLTGCDRHAINHPHQSAKSQQTIYYGSFNESPRTLDPARSYSSNEALFTAQIYEPPLQYHYLQRPYQLVPLTVQQMPTVTYVDAAGKKLPDDAPARQVAYTYYDIKIKPDIYYQPHPAFAKDQVGDYLYHDLTAKELAGVDELADFDKAGTRELVAQDYVYQIKRLAHPGLNSPILALMRNYIVGLSPYAETLAKTYQQQHNSGYLALRNFPLSGAKATGRYSYRITVKGKYPQFIYWLAMPFFAPIPWEADYFYAQPGMREANISFNWYPVGTGPYMLVENNPNRQMVLRRNPNFHGEIYPKQGEAKDVQAGVLKDAGKPLPLIDTFIFSLEKESIPRWNKFLQGYYDQSSVGSDSFDQAIQIDQSGKPQLTPELKYKGIHLQTTVTPGIFYIGFNMLDDVVGGYSKRARKLRRAISIAVHHEEFISIFLNGRGMPAHGPIPPGIFGYLPAASGINPYVYGWVNGRAQRHSLARAKQLLKEAGYANGRDKKTGKPLVLNFDVPSASGPDDKARFDWMRKQFAKLNIQLNVRSTQYNRFQEKMRNGNAQIFTWGWLADYPDPENFLFLLYGPNGKVKRGGENASNYTNPQFDALFAEMKNTPNGPKRQAIINKMVAIAQFDAPWIWGFFPQDFLLSHQWLALRKPNSMANNTLKYQRLVSLQRNALQKQWNKPIIWPLLVILLIIILIFIPVFYLYYKKIHQVN